MKWLNGAAATTGALLLLFVLPAESSAQDAAEKRQQALERRAKLSTLLSDYLVTHPEADLDGDGKLTSPERSKHVGKLYRQKILKQLDGQIRFHGEVEYARVGETSLQLDLYLPQDNTTKPPLVIWLHGGGWRGGSKDHCLVAFLATRGFAVASVEYRSTLVAPFPNNIHDCKGAIRWLRANAATYGFDAEKIGVSGASAGGHLASLMGTSGEVKGLEGSVGGNTNESSRVQAVVNMCGVIDIAAWTNSERGLSLMLGLPFDAAKDNGAKQLAALCNPQRHISKDDPPLLVLHGDKDKSVPLKQSREFHAAYQKAGLESRLSVLKNTGHVSPHFTDAARQKQMTAFFTRHLR